MFCSKDFMNRQRKYNNETLEQLWLSIVNDSHECICQCDYPFAHILSAIFPLGHADRKLTIEQILARDFKQKCLSGGAGDAATLTPTTGIKREEEKPLEENQEEEPTDEDLAALLAAADAAAEAR
nr:MAG: hypothetical protein [Gammatorquevirus sp.]